MNKETTTMIKIQIEIKKDSVEFLVCIHPGPMGKTSRMKLIQLTPTLMFFEGLADICCFSSVTPIGNMAWLGVIPLTKWAFDF